MASKGRCGGRICGKAGCETPYGRCHCGCGEFTNVPTRNIYKIGHVKGRPVQYVTGHNNHVEPTRWSGGRSVRRGRNTKYVYVLAHGHPHADPKGYVREHVLIASAALGKPLPAGAVVHHVNENGMDNRPCNLVVCQDNAYHKLLHYRLNALRACGNANWLRCRVCGEYDDPEAGNMYTGRRPSDAQHRACHTRYQRELRERNARAA